MAEDEKKDDAPEEEAKPSAADNIKDQVKKKSSIIIIAVLVVVGLILAGVISFFVTTKLMSNSGGNGGDGGKVVQSHEPGIFIKLGDEKEGILVNVGGVKGGHFLKVGLVLELNLGQKEIVSKDGKINKMAETKILDTTLRLLRSEKIDNFDASKQDALKKKIKEELNTVLGGVAVYDVYITSIVLQ